VTYDWSEEKNRLLKARRRISFEEIVLCIQENKVVTGLEHPNRGRYPNQYLYLIEARQQIYVVPFAVNSAEGVVFLKAIYPSRKCTRQYLEGIDENQVR
jgi:uncharacterized DUF497 family protein